MPTVNPLMQSSITKVSQDPKTQESSVTVSVFPNPNVGQQQQSETLVLPSMGGATITLHAASSEVVDKSFNAGKVKASGGQNNAAVVIQKNSGKTHNLTSSGDATTRNRIVTPPCTPSSTITPQKRCFDEM